MTNIPDEIIFKDGSSVIINIATGCHTWIGNTANTIGHWFRKYHAKGVSEAALFSYMLDNDTYGLISNTITYNV